MLNAFRREVQDRDTPDYGMYADVAAESDESALASSDDVHLLREAYNGGVALVNRRHDFLSLVKKKPVAVIEAFKKIVFLPSEALSELSGD